MSTPTLAAHLIEDASLLDETVPVDDTVEQHLALVDGRQAGATGSLVVSDRRLAELSRAVPAGRRPRVTVVNTSGAGGLVALAERDLDAVQVVAAVSTLRDLDDLGGNARRVVAATEVLDPEVIVHVGLPRAHGWERAAEEVEAAGLHAAVDLTPAGGANSPAALAAQLHALVELDLPFRVSGVCGDPVTLPGLLVAVQALVEDVDVDQAAGLLGVDAAAAAHTITGWDESTGSRVRRRLSAIAGAPAAGLLDDLVRLGLLPAP